MNDPIQGAYPGTRPQQVVPAVEASRPALPPGWYADPHGVGQRWWSGQAWTEHVAAPTPAPYQRADSYAFPPQVVVNTSTVIAIGRQKSVGVALILAFLFGPLGMLYSTVLGALLMAAVIVVGGILVTGVTFGLGLAVFIPACWLVCIVWAGIAAA